jgi:hypothetical protein
MRKNIARCLQGLAGVVVGEGQLAQATMLLSAVATLRAAIHVVPLPDEQAACDHLAASVRARLGAAVFAAAWAEGQAMAASSGIARAVSDRPSADASG